MNGARFSMLNTQSSSDSITAALQNCLVASANHYYFHVDQSYDKDLGLYRDNLGKRVDIYILNKTVIITGHGGTLKKFRSEELKNLSTEEKEIDIGKLVEDHEHVIKKLQFTYNTKELTTVTLQGENVKKHPLYEHTDSSNLTLVTLVNPFGKDERLEITCSREGHVSSKNLQHGHVYDLAKKLIKNYSN